MVFYVLPIYSDKFVFRVFNLVLIRNILISAAAGEECAGRLFFLI